IGDGHIEALRLEEPLFERDGQSELVDARHHARVHLDEVVILRARPKGHRQRKADRYGKPSFHSFPPHVSGSTRSTQKGRASFLMSALLTPRTCTEFSLVPETRPSF